MLVLSWFYCFTAHDTPQHRRLHQIRMHPDYNMLMCFFLMCFIHITSPFFASGYQDSNLISHVPNVARLPLRDTRRSYFLHRHCLHLQVQSGLHWHFRCRFVQQHPHGMPLFAGG